MPYRFMRYPDGKAKAVTFSYDDAALSDLKLIEICNKFGIKCTFNINSIILSDGCGNNKLSAEDIKKSILENGHEVAVHGHEHKAPGICTDAEIISDVFECRKKLEKAFDLIIRGMAYPDSGIVHVSDKRYSEIRSLLKSMGIVYSRTLGGDNNRFRLPDDWFKWMPTAHHENPNIFEYAKEFTELNVSDCYYADRYPRLFYLWGHSFEFKNNNNWDRLEKICEALGNKDDIWYATNIQIYDYVKAYDSLIFNAENRKVFNPSICDVWFYYDEKVYCVKSGETIDF